MEVSKIFFVICSLYFLSACDRGSPLNIRSTPNEFKSWERAPLEIPDKSAGLPAPKEGAPRPQETTVQQDIKSVIAG